MKNYIWIIAIAAFAVVSYLVLQRVDQNLKNTAINDCGKVARYEIRPDEKTYISYPLGDVYKECIRMKGYLPETK